MGDSGAVSKCWWSGAVASYHQKLRHFYFRNIAFFFQSDAFDYLAEVTLLNKIFRSVKKDNSMSFTQDF